MAERPKFVWDTALGRFRYASTGRLVPLTQIRGAIDTALNNARLRVRSITDSERLGLISTAEWESEMRAMIKATQLYSSAAAKGGFEMLTQRDFGRIGGHVAREYGYLRQFREQIEAGQIVSDGTLLNRAESYAEAARRTYHQADKDVRAEQGADRVRNVLHPADHCAECLALTDAGAVPLDEMPDPGDRECGNGCKCSLAFESSEAAQEAAAE